MAPLKRPTRKSPLQRTRQPLKPPGRRSRRAHDLTLAAAEGRFALPCCAACGAYAYPAREACPQCLSEDLTLRDAPAGGVLVSRTEAQVPGDNYFRERAPWQVGLVRMDCGPVALVHLHDGCVVDGRVWLSLRLDKAGQAVFHARPPEGDFDMMDDPQWRELVADPKFRRILITDGRHPVTLPLVTALQGAGCGDVVIGVPQAWKPFAGRDALAALPGVTLIELDLTSERSVIDASLDYAAKTEILINTADYLRPGRIWGAGQLNSAREAMEVIYFGALRLAQAFGPVMAARGADGVGAAAWVNLLSVYAEAHAPDHAAYAAAQSAAVALSHGLRAELAQGGVRLLNVFTGPTEDEWHQVQPAPKVGQKALAEAVIAGLRQGLEESYVGDVAKDLHTRAQRNAKALERDLAGGS